MSASPSEGAFVGLIADGNRRGYTKYLERQDGIKRDPLALTPGELYEAYRTGGEAIKSIIETARDEAVGLLAVYAWSMSNMAKRTEAERKAVFGVVGTFIDDLRDNWMDRSANKDVRLVHMGHKDRIQAHDHELMESINSMCKDTRDREGMAVILCMDYDGFEEEKDARLSWIESGHSDSFHDHLYLPREGIPYQPLGLLIRTGTEGQFGYTNGYLHPYYGPKTLLLSRRECLQEYGGHAFLQDFRNYQQHVVELRQGR